MEPLLVESISGTDKHYNSFGNSAKATLGNYGESDRLRTTSGFYSLCIQCLINNCYTGIYRRQFTYPLAKLHCNAPQLLDS